MMMIKIYEVEDHGHDSRYWIPIETAWQMQPRSVLAAALNLILCCRTRSEKLYLLGIYQVEMERFR